MSNPVDFPDWSKPGQVGVGQLVYQTSQTLLAAAHASFGPFYVGTGNAILMAMESTPVSGQTVTFFNNSYLDSAATQAIWVQKWVQKNIGFTVDVVTAMSPYMTFKVNNDSGIGSATYSLSAVLLPGAVPANASGGYTFVSGRILAVNNQASLGAGLTADQSPDMSIPGPATMAIYSSQPGATARIKVNCGPYANQIVQIVTNGNTAGFGETQPVTVPNDDWMLELGNSSASAANCFGVVMSSR